MSLTEETSHNLSPDSIVKCTVSTEYIEFHIARGLPQRIRDTWVAAIRKLDCDMWGRGLTSTTHTFGKNSLQPELCIGASKDIDAWEIIDYIRSQLNITELRLERITDGSQGSQS